MKSNVLLKLKDNTLADKIKRYFPEKDYTITAEVGRDSTIIVTDDLDFINTLKDNVKNPVLYISTNAAGIDDRFTSEKNIFRAIIPSPEFDSVIEIPAKEQPDQKKNLEDIINFGLVASKAIDRFSLILAKEGQKRIQDEKYYTLKGDYGAADVHEDVRKIRGDKRSISTVEAAYQASRIFLIYDPHKAKATYFSRILFISPNTERINQYAQFMRHMLSDSVVEVLNQYDAPPAQKLVKENYSIIIFDCSKLDTDPLGSHYFVELINEAWNNHVEILPMCNTKKLLRIITDTKMVYKIHNIIPEEPHHYEFIEKIMHMLDQHTNTKLIELLDDPADALFNDAVQNIRSIDEKIIARGKKQLLYAIFLKTGRNLEEPEEMKVYATDELLKSQPIVLSEIGMLIKIFNDERRAKCETIITKFLQEYNTQRENKLTEVRAGNLSKKEELYWTNMPKINTRKEVFANQTVMIGTYIFGPTLKNLAPEISKKIEEGDKEAKEFRDQVLFKMNEYCAFFQIKKIPLPGIESENTKFTEDFTNAIDKILHLGIAISKPEYDCAKICAEIFDSNIADPNSTRYFDFYWDNIIFKTGMDAHTFESLMMKRKVEKMNIKQFVEETIHRIDFNKIYRNTSMTEDPSRFAVKNFMRDPKTTADVLETEREYFYTHFLLCRKKFQLLEQLYSTQEDYDQFAPKIQELSDIIKKIESHKSLDKFNEKISEHVADEKDKFMQTERYVTAYRAERHSILSYNSLRNTYEQKERGRLNEDEFKKSIDFLKDDLRGTYAQTAKILKIISDEKKEYLKKIKTEIKQYKQLIDDAQKQLTKEIAGSVVEQLKEIRKNPNPEEQNVLFTYVAAGYLSAFFKKIHSSEFNVNYEAL